MSNKRHNTYISNIYTSSDDDEDLLDTRNNKFLEKRNNKLFERKNDNKLFGKDDNNKLFERDDELDQLDHKHLSKYNKYSYVMGNFY